ncbi:Ribosomal protein S5 2-like protein [Glarea lozoyensis ATCC 20868]|uniref:Phosphomevalonate kinase n=1 Tax=Glarea lozoyensis (strain ATCC 20868 / MF5171) TaxID=1116229 RepID=S3DCJ6_GLAL2|nr:Ribosomal protein S5 2-like protein [Glarea lozoyensis ATCC 20868]EPE24408.1 Ribosomal protein S5 2-like protein [Glarea lozoyensis ATCC 20868]
MSTAVSAPGKVLLAGGYLVLDRTYTGLVFGLSARIHVLVHDIASSSGVEISEIIVHSPQFQAASWNYGYNLVKERGGVHVTQLQGYSAEPSSRNPFVQTALEYALTYISTVLPASQKIEPTKLTILADDSYYSNPPQSTVTPDSRFSDFNVTLKQAHKTGLGSSAALVTAFTGALLSHYLPRSSFDLASTEGKNILHNLAQAAHCAAQGKVGSGFDVAAAVYGTCIYRRFSPSILSSLGEPGSKDFASRVKSVVDNTSTMKHENWDTEISSNSVSVSKGYALVMCDVDCGSETVGMVKKVLEWRKNDPDGSKKLWDALQISNESLASALSSENKEDVTSAFSAVREKIREMGTASGVPIEPAEQTELIDAVTAAVPGVLGGVVPGAGGYDAIVLLAQDDEATVGNINNFLKKWMAEHQNGVVKLLEAKGELEGARLEDVKVYGKGFAS